jgi:3'-5' exoribonuclease
MAFAGSAPPVDARTVATLRPGEDVDALFACTRKDRAISRSGQPYLTVELRDSSGSILGRAFREADVLSARFEQGELVHVRGRVERFREQLQLELRSIDSAVEQDVDPGRFLPSSQRDLDELEGFLEHLARELYDAGLRGLVARVLGDVALRAEIRRAPCSLPPSPGGARAGGGSRVAVHHAYLGGLLEHTVAVATLAIELCAVHPRLDRDLLLGAAIVHDLGKTREFTYGARIERSREGAMLGHLELGLRVIAEHAPPALEGERRLALEHCVMLHHGPDAASGRRFASAEALALHRLNALDSQLKAALEQRRSA